MSVYDAFGVALGIVIAATFLIWYLRCLWVLLFSTYSLYGFVHNYHSGDIFVAINALIGIGGLTFLVWQVGN